MIMEYGTEAFKNEWLEFLKEDPVHPSIPIQVRVTGSRTILALVENDIPQAIICVRFGNKLPQNMQYVLNDEEITQEIDSPRYAVFYSIFRLQHATLKGAGALAIKEAKAYLKTKGIKRFYTLSPIPQLTKQFKNIPSEDEIIKYLKTGNGPVSKFHLGNGAEIHAIDFNADMSAQRIVESWGIMVNYDYSDYA
jgi:malonyl-CoA decarboxylase